MLRYLTTDYLRKEIQDRFPSDNEIEQDQFFSDDEILHAMQQAANAYNGMAPIGIDRVTALSLPAVGTNAFVDAVVAFLYRQAIHKLRRNLITWNTGDTTVDIEKTRLAAFKEAADEMDKLWRQEAMERKVEINRNQAWAYM